MHFSSPSVYRLRTWRPWKRGAVGLRSSGYCVVTFGLRMCLAVTIRPLMSSATATRDTPSQTQGCEVLARDLRQRDHGREPEYRPDPREQRAAVDLLRQHGQGRGDHHPRETRRDEDL